MTRTESRTHASLIHAGKRAHKLATIDRREHIVVEEVITECRKRGATRPYRPMETYHQVFIDVCVHVPDDGRGCEVHRVTSAISRMVN